MIQKFIYFKFLLDIFIDIFNNIISIFFRFGSTSFQNFIDFISYSFEMSWFWKHTFREVYVLTFDVLVLFVLEKYCFEIVGYDNILTNVFIFSRKIDCSVMPFLKWYIWDFIRLKKNSFRQSSKKQVSEISKLFI